MSQLRDRLPSSSPAAHGPRPARWYAVGCAALFLACLLVARPWSPTPIVDDWSYLKSAEVLARTGHVVYNGWATAMLGWQLYAGAAMVRLFGPSFAAVRSFTMLAAVLTVFLLQRLLVRCGVREPLAAAGTLVLTLSPIFLQLSATYMSDIPGVLALVVCWYACVRALTASLDRSASAWIVFAALGNVVLGSCRQIAWLGVLVLVPSTLWLLYRRRRRQALLAGIAAEAIAVLLVFAALHWFAHQPYSLSDTGLVHVNRRQVPHMLAEMTQAVLEPLFLVLPLLVAFVPRVMKTRGRALAAAAACFAFVLAGGVVASHRGWELPLGPFLQNWYSRFGHFNIETPLVQPPPVVLSLPLLVAINTVFYLGVLSAATYAWRLRGAQLGQRAGVLAWRDLLVLVGPFTVVYLLLLIPRSSGGLADRYCVPLAIVAALLLLRLWSDREGRLPWAAHVALALVALFSVGAVHDLFAYYRAKGALVAEMESAGVPATAIDNGWDFDGWTELEHADHVNDARLRVPAGAYRFKAPADPRSCFFPPFADLFPHVEPLYGVRYNPQDCYGEAGFAPVSYTRWLGRRATFYAVRYLPAQASAAGEPAHQSEPAR